MTIAEMAPRRIWRLKLAETFLVWSFCASTFVTSVFCRFVCCAVSSFSSLIWKLL
jgi:hypothetical protein